MGRKFIFHKPRRFRKCDIAVGVFHAVVLAVVLFLVGGCHVLVVHQDASVTGCEVSDALPCRD